MSRLLATGKVDVNTADISEKTALHYAAKRGHETIVALLLSEGHASPNLTGNLGLTPIFPALRWGGESWRG